MTLDEIFKPNGLLSGHFLEYEQRTGQVEMAKLVESAIKSSYSAVIEGATGVGKSFAYLIPLILSGEQTIISTSNKSLQDQLSNKDLPSLKKILPVEFTWEVLKGKNNYFCHEHFKMHEKEIKAYLMRQGMDNTEAKLKLKEIAKWATETLDGDIEYYPNNLPQPIKEMISCDTRTVHEKESIYAKLCFANKARERAKKARILLINHTLLALDVSLRRETDGEAKILPDAQVIIIDEAHTFERYAIMAFSDDISWFSLFHLINWSIVHKSVDAEFINTLVEAFKGVLNGFIPEKGISGYYSQKKFDKFEGFDKVILMLETLITKIKNDEKVNKDDVGRAKVKEVTKETDNLIKRLLALSVEDENMLKWSEAKTNERGEPSVRLKSVPIDISGILREGLFENHVVICTSATLAVNGNFDFFRYQVGMPETALELIVESPFDFKKNALVYISTGEKEKHWEMSKLLSYSKGRAFVLFTSYKDMKYFYDVVDTPYPKLIQDNGISRVQLLEDFKNTPNAILFATKSFWEGVDVKGAQLSMVIIHKLPFENPSDLVYSSKIEKIDAKLGKGKHWSKFTIPDACLKLKQGIGRLIRSQTDTGVIAILDARINYQSYGKIVLKSLPNAYRTQKLEKVEQAFKKWELGN